MKNIEKSFPTFSGSVWQVINISRDSISIQNVQCCKRSYAPRIGLCKWIEWLGEKRKLSNQSIKIYTDLLFMKISRQDIAKAHVEYWLSTEMQNLKGVKGKICVFYQRGFGQFDSCITCWIFVGIWAWRWVRCLMKWNFDTAEWQEAWTNCITHACNEATQLHTNGYIIHGRVDFKMYKEIFTLSICLWFWLSLCFNCFLFLIGRLQSVESVTQGDNFNIMHWERHKC